MADPIVLSFHDSLLRKSDVKLLSKNNWLNDKIIAFAFEYFEKILFEKNAGRVIFITPDVSQFIKLTPTNDELAVFLDPLDLPSKDYVFLAINDNSNAAQAGGSHWSLLMYDRPQKQFKHYDSSGIYNKQAAGEVAKKAQKYLFASDNTVHDQQTPRQANCYDCGVYVIAITEYLCHQLFEKQNAAVSLNEALTPQRITQIRNELNDLITRLAQSA